MNYRKTIRRLVFLSLFAMGTVTIQAQTVTKVFEATPLNNVLKEVEKQTGFSIMYNNDDLNGSKAVTHTFENSSVEEVLKTVLPSHLEFQLQNKMIVISRKGSHGTQQKTVKKVSGTIVDAEGEPIIGANVLIKGTTNGVITDIDGNYTLNEVPANAIISISYIGYQPLEFKVGSKELAKVVMKEDTEVLDEVVVVGYGGQKRREITGAIASVKVEELPSTGAASVTQMLSGKAAGLYTNIASAQPGGRVDLRIRGEATGRSPLIVIDGFPGSGFDNASAGQFSSGKTESVLASINPNDIESIDILKDASATSIYGTRAAGGVILITTKRGRSSKTSVEFNASLMFSKAYNVPKILNAEDYMLETNRAYKEYFMFENGVGVYGDKTWEEVEHLYKPRYSDEEIKAYENNPGTDWVDEIMRVGVVQNYGVNVSSGNEKTKYYISLGYYDNKGIIKNNEYGKYMSQVNVDQKIGSKVSAGLTFNLSRLKLNNVPMDGEAGDQSDIFRTAYLFDPTLPVKDENGDYSLMQGAAVLSNPVSMLDIKSETQTDHLLGNLSLTWDVISGLRLKGIVGADIYYSQANHYLPSTTLAGASTNGKAAKQLNTKNDYQAQLLATYNKSFDKHNLDIMLGSEFIQSNWSGFSASNQDFVTDGFLWNNLAMGASESPTVGSWGGKSETMSYVSRIKYNYDDKYFLTANFRIDGSSNFAANHQWGYFPGISVAWDIARENFMRRTSGYLDQLKLRIGYGQTGNDNIGTAFFNYYAPGEKILWGDQLISSIGLAGLGNPDLKWEVQTDLNIGLDFSFLKGRIYGNVEYFNRVISNLLGWRQLSSLNEVTGMSCNLDAKKRTYGYEFSLNSKNFDTKNFKWNTNLTFSYYRDRWLKRDANWKPDIYESEKADLAELWYFISDGFFKEGDTFGVNENGEPIEMIPGTVKIKDVDGYLLDEAGNRVLDENGKPKRLGKPDGKIDNADLVKIGVNTPYTIGLTNTFNYKNFDLAVSLYGKFNYWRSNSTTQMLTNLRLMVDESANLSYDVKDAWYSDHQDAKYPSILQNSSRINGGTGDLYLEKAWYIRVNNIDLGYTIPWKSSGISRLRVYVSLQNPFIITPYTGMDPETNYGSTSYPNQRNYAFGVQVNF